MLPDSPAPQSEPGRDLFSTARVPLSGSAPASPRGFGPILQQEYALQAALEAERAEASGRRAKDLVRILDQQQTQLSVGIATLNRRCEDLPYAERFHREGWGQPLNANPASAPSSRRHGLADLAVMHRDLASNLRDVMKHNATPQAESALESVARDHEEMARVLSALPPGATRGEALWGAALSPPPKLSNGELRWENEGGAVEPTTNVPASDRPSPATS